MLKKEYFGNCGWLRLTSTCKPSVYRGTELLDGFELDYPKYALIRTEDGGQEVKRVKWDVREEQFYFLKDKYQVQAIPNEDVICWTFIDGDELKKVV